MDLDDAVRYALAVTPTLEDVDHKLNGTGPFICYGGELVGWNYSKTSDMYRSLCWYRRKQAANFRPPLTE